MSITLPPFVLHAGEAIWISGFDGQTLHVELYGKADGKLWRSTMQLSMELASEKPQIAAKLMRSDLDAAVKILRNQPLTKEN